MPRDTQRFRLKLKSLSFISAVDVPAQETATAAIIKRDGGADVTAHCEVAKIDDELGIVIGWALTSTVDGADYFDLQGDAIDEDSLVKVAADYMADGGFTDAMHDESEDGRVVFCFPLTSEIAKALDIETEKTGLLVGIKPSPETLAKFKDGEYTGFSIAGYGERQAVKGKKTIKCAKCSGYMAKDAAKCPSCGAAMPPKKRADVEKATWSTAYVDDLADSSFLYVEGGGSKDSSGKTTPRSLRHFPYKDVNGKIDIAHLRDAIGRIPQSSLPASLKEKLQQKAEKLLAKQHGDEKRAAAIAKHAYLTTEVDGHTHLLDHDNGQAAGYTDYAYDASNGQYHCHPWTRNSALDTFVVGAAANHEHQVITQQQVDQLVASGEATADIDLDDLPDMDQQGDMNKRAPVAKGNAMKTEKEQIADLTKKLEKRDAEIERLKKKYDMSDAQRALYKSFEKDEDKTAFLAKSNAERDEMVAKALEADPIVVELDGVPYRKSAGEATLAIVKRAKDTAEQLAKRDAELNDERLAKRAGLELGNLPGEVKHKVTLLKAIDAIADEPTKTAVKAMVAAGNAGLSKLYDTLGHGAKPSDGASAGESSAQTQLAALTKQHAEQNKVSEALAMGAVLKTAEGKRLYAEIELAKRAKQN